MKLSILIPTLPSRFAFFARLWAILEPQLTPEVEVLWLGDNKKRTVGAKRNALLREAKGDYLVFLDDDDLIEPSFCEEILKAIDESPDVICYHSLVTIDNGPPKLCQYGLDLEYTETRELWTGKPAHTMPVRREIAQRCSFPDKQFGEDFEYVAQVWPQCKTQVKIPKVLYHYQFCNATTETREGRKRRRK